VEAGRISLKRSYFSKKQHKVKKNEEDYFYTTVKTSNGTSMELKEIREAMT
jgi:hypothetical protein